AARARTKVESVARAEESATARREAPGTARWKERSPSSREAQIQERDCSKLIVVIAIVVFLDEAVQIHVVRHAIARAGLQAKGRRLEVVLFLQIGREVHRRHATLDVERVAHHVDARRPVDAGARAAEALLVVRLAAYEAIARQPPAPTGGQPQRLR